MSLFLRPSFSKGIPNTFLRKKRKWPHSPYKTKWHHLFDQQQAMQNLKQLASSPPPSQIQGKTQNPNKTPYLLSCLVTSFKAYDCEPTTGAYRFLVKTLTQNSQFTELDLVLLHLQNFEKFETPERLFSDLIRIYGDNGMFREAIDLFFRIPKFRCVPTVCSLNSLLSILCRNEEYIQLVPEILTRCRIMNVRIDESSFSILISTLCRIRKVDYAIKLLNSIIDDGFEPDRKVYSLILSSLCKQKATSSSQVIGFLREMKRVKLCLSIVDFCNVIRYLLTKGKNIDAFGILNDMKTEGIKPDITCYTMVLNGVIEEGDFIRAEELFDEILIFGLIPDVNTYNVYINGLCKQDKVEEGYKMIGWMENLGCKPNSETYKIVLEAFCKLREFNRAGEIWREMKLKGAQNLHAYRIMVCALIRRSEIVEAFQLIEEMVNRGFVPSSSTIEEMISVMCKAGFVAEALLMLRKVFDHAIVLQAGAWEALLLGLKLNPGLTNATLANLVNT
ncbi:hypothetical protein Nepgr_024980 [Nepenthes gracilis]|uniref:Pentatricopeptide repeat-containing protein n=1 Tax=Nepenthes gracilis TaxID=150966 RepID=A0AAD3T5K0_NEPGR|nr:hypothetical protein Nepgr_024980 [Nepenthes gracilis]